MSTDWILYGVQYLAKMLMEFFLDTMCAIEYTIQYSFTNSVVNTSTRVFTMTGLKKATTYEIKVTGRTSVGEGADRYIYPYTGM